jgi:hypothetical protein
MANEELLNKLRMDAASQGMQPPLGVEPAPAPDDGGEQFGMPLGEGEGKLSPEELEAGKMIAKSMPAEQLQALMALPPEQLEQLLAAELKKNNVDDVDIPDIIEIVKSIVGKPEIE